VKNEKTRQYFPQDFSSYGGVLEYYKKKVKVSRNRPEQTQGFPGRLRPRIFLTFGTTRVVGRKPYAPAAFTPGEIPGTHF
jgi:hypothetical protein